MNGTISQNSAVSKLETLLLKYPIILQIFRFVAIGVLNTTLDFIIFNFLSKALGIESGVSLGVVNVVGFSLAVVQSYLWNRYWAFSNDVVSLLKNFFRLVMVGGTGAIGFLLVLLGVKFSAQPIFYLLILATFIVVEIVLWFYFGLNRAAKNLTASQNKFVVFIVVSLIGLLINSLLISSASRYIASDSKLVLSPDTVKNLAKVLATAISLIWNFIGYKLFVFKK